MTTATGVVDYARRWKCWFVGDYESGFEDPDTMCGNDLQVAQPGRPDKDIVLGSDKILASHNELKQRLHGDWNKWRITCNLVVNKGYYTKFFCHALEQEKGRENEG